MVYIFQELRINGPHAFVVFNEAANEKPLEIEVQSFLCGQYKQALTIPSEQVGRALFKIVDRGFVPEERKLA